MPYGKYQIRVKLRDQQVHTSGTTKYETAFKRTQAEIIVAGVGAIGTLYEFSTKQSKTPDLLKMVPLYQGRAVFSVEHSDGTVTVVPEDHTTPPPAPPAPPAEPHHEPEHHPAPSPTTPEHHG